VRIPERLKKGGKKKDRGEGIVIPVSKGQRLLKTSKKRDNKGLCKKKKLYTPFNIQGGEGRSETFTSQAEKKEKKKKIQLLIFGNEEKGGGFGIKKKKCLTDSRRHSQGREGEKRGGTPSRNLRRPSRGERGMAYGIC